MSVFIEIGPNLYIGDQAAAEQCARKKDFGCIINCAAESSEWQCVGSSNGSNVCGSNYVEAPLFVEPKQKAKGVEPTKVEEAQAPATDEVAEEEEEPEEPEYISYLPIQINLPILDMPSEDILQYLDGAIETIESVNDDLCQETQKFLAENEEELPENGTFIVVKVDRKPLQGAENGGSSGSTPAGSRSSSSSTPAAVPLRPGTASTGTGARSNRPKLGIQWHPNMFKNKKLVVQEVAEGGLVADWNNKRLNPDFRIDYGDKLIAVDGQTEWSKIAKAMKGTVKGNAKANIEQGEAGEANNSTWPNTSEIQTLIFWRPRKNAIRTNTLVHCVSGISRSSTVICAYLMKSVGNIGVGLSMGNAFYHILAAKHPEAFPNQGFVNQLAIFQEMSCRVGGGGRLAVAAPAAPEMETDSTNTAASGSLRSSSLRNSSGSVRIKHLRHTGVVVASEFGSSSRTIIFASNSRGGKTASSRIDGKAGNKEIHRQYRMWRGAAQAAMLSGFAARRCGNMPQAPWMEGVEGGSTQQNETTATANHNVCEAIAEGKQEEGESEEKGEVEKEKEGKEGGEEEKQREEGATGMEIETQEAREDSEGKKEAGQEKGKAEVNPAAIEGVVQQVATAIEGGVEEVQHEDQQDAPQEADVDALESISQGPPPPENWKYLCKLCRAELFTTDNILTDLEHQEGPEWNKPKCPSRENAHWVEPMDWMENSLYGEGGQSGKLFCGGSVRGPGGTTKPCNAKIGAWSWIGLKCGCHAFHSPAFQIQKARVDEMPMESSARGGPAKEIF